MIGRSEFCNFVMFKISGDFMLKSFIVMVLLGLTIGVGCKNISSTTENRPQQTVDPNKALEAFVDGVTKDNMNLFQEAIMSYQKSLIYDSTTTHAATTYYMLSKAYLKIRKPNFALQSGIKAVELDSSNNEYQTQLAQLYIETNQYKEASKIYEKLSEENPDNQEYLYRSAQLFQMTKNLQKALNGFELYIQKFGEDFNVRMQQLLIYDALNDRKKIVAVLNKMLEDDPSNDNLRKTLSREYITSSQFDSASVVLLPILDTKPDDPQTLVALAEIQFRSNNLPESRKFVKQLIESSEIDDNELMIIGGQYIDSGRKDSISLNFAIEFFGQFEKLRPDNWRPKWFLAINFLQKKQNKEAIVRLESVVKSDPTFNDAWQQLSLAFLVDNEFSKASDVLTRALTYHPMDFQLNYFKGISDARVGRDSTAESYLKKAIKLNPYSVEPMGELANIYDRQNRHAESDSVYERILRIDPDNHNALNNYAYSLSERNLQIERCEEMSKRSLVKEPNNAAYLDTYGWILFKMKKYDAAIEYIKKSIDTGEASQVVVEHLGDIYAELKDFVQAKIWYEKALKMNTATKRIAEKLKQIE